MTWTPWALPGLVVLFAGIPLAWFIYRSRPDRHQNRILALQILLEAVAVGIIGGAPWVLTDSGWVRFLGLFAMFLVWPKLWSYYSFLATLDTPLAVPLRRRGVLPAILVGTLLAGLTVVFRPGWYGGDVVFWPLTSALVLTPGTHFIAILWMWATMWIAGLSFSISALRHARTEIVRQQARMFLVAFGFRDVAFVLCVLAFTVVPPTYERFHWVFVAFPCTLLIYYPLIAWGILRYQLFDIELRVKRGLQRSFIASVLATGFFVLNYALEQMIEVNNFVLGLALAGGVTLVFQPVQRAAGRFADRVMPGVEESEPYLLERRQEVYRNAVEAALMDGAVTDRERAILSQLQESLGVPTEEAAEIETEAARTLTVESS